MEGGGGEAEGVGSNCGGFNHRRLFKGKAFRKGKEHPLFNDCILSKDSILLVLITAYPKNSAVITEVEEPVLTEVAAPTEDR